MVGKKTEENADGVADVIDAIAVHVSALEWSGSSRAVALLAVAGFRQPVPAFGRKRIGEGGAISFCSSAGEASGLDLRGDFVALRAAWRGGLLAGAMHGTARQEILDQSRAVIGGAATLGAGRRDLVRSGLAALIASSWRRRRGFLDAGGEEIVDRLAASLLDRSRAIFSGTPGGDASRNVSLFTSLAFTEEIAGLLGAPFVAARSLTGAPLDAAGVKLVGFGPAVLRVASLLGALREHAISDRRAAILAGWSRSVAAVLAAGLEGIALRRALIGRPAVSNAAIVELRRNCRAALRAGGRGGRGRRASFQAALPDVLRLSLAIRSPFRTAMLQDLRRGAVAAILAAWRVRVLAAPAALLAGMLGLIRAVVGISSVGNALVKDRLGSVRAFGGAGWMGLVLAVLKTLFTEMVSPGLASGGVPAVVDALLLQTIGNGEAPVLASGGCRRLGAPAIIEASGKLVLGVSGAIRFGAAGRDTILEPLPCIHGALRLAGKRRRFLATAETVAQNLIGFLLALLLATAAGAAGIHNALRRLGAPVGAGLRGRKEVWRPAPVEAKVKGSLGRRLAILSIAGLTCLANLFRLEPAEVGAARRRRGRGRRIPAHRKTSLQVLLGLTGAFNLCPARGHTIANLGLDLRSTGFFALLAGRRRRWGAFGVTTL